LAAKIAVPQAADMVAFAKCDLLYVLAQLARRCPALAWTAADPNPHS